MLRTIERAGFTETSFVTIVTIVSIVSIVALAARSYLDGPFNVLLWMDVRWHNAGDLIPKLNTQAASTFLRLLQGMPPHWRRF